MKIPSSEHGENMLCTKIDLNIRNNFCTQHVLPRFKLGIFMSWTMNNLLSYCGLVYAKIRASDKDLPVSWKFGLESLLCLNTFFGGLAPPIGLEACHDSVSWKFGLGSLLCLWLWKLGGLVPPLGLESCHDFVSGKLGFCRKGQLISKANFLVLIWTKKRKKLFFWILP